MNTRGDKGFTLAELMVASLLFAMVIAGLATIYATLFKQTGRVMSENMLKNQATVAMRAIKQEIGQATMLTVPALGSSSNHLAGCRNLLSDGTIVESSAKAYMEGASSGFGFGCFRFCVRPTELVGSQCLTGSQTPPPCLFYYRPESGLVAVGWRNQPNSPPGPAVDDSTCGTSVGGILPQQLASNLVLPTGVGNYFNRTGAGAVEGNVVRTAFVLRKDKGPNHGRLVYEVDSTTQLNMGLE